MNPDEANQVPADSPQSVSRGPSPDPPASLTPPGGSAPGHRPQGPAKLVAGLLSAMLLAAVAWPINENFQKNPKDDFPFSYYPMFTHERGTAMSVNHLVGITGDGREVPVNYRRAGDGGFNQIRRQINRYVRNNNADVLIERVARELAESTRKEEVEIEEVRIVRSRFRFAEYFNGNKEPFKREVVVSAPIERSSEQEEARKDHMEELADEPAQTQSDSVVQRDVCGGRS